MPLAGGDPVAELGGVEADRSRSPDGNSLDLTAGGVDARGNIAGDHRGAAAVDRLDCRQGGLARRPREAGAEDRVDDSAGAGQAVVEVGGVDLFRAETVEVGRRIWTELVRRPQQQRLDREAGRRQ